MKSLRLILAVSALLLYTLTWDATAQVNITTWQVDLQHSGNNASETALTPGTISSPGNFGFLFAQTMDGLTFGQPLLASGVNVGGVTHNIVYAATEHCSLFAFDADNNTGSNASALWQISMLPTGTVPVPQSVVGSGDIPVELGITTTPVIDTSSSTIYIVSKVQRTSDTTYHQYLYALDLATGATKYGSPIEINPTFPGSSTPDSSGGVVPFSALHEHLRSAMTLYNGVVYLAYASHSDTTPYHGEVVGYDAKTLQLVKTFITTPNGGNPEGGIWGGGAGPAFDSAGNMYFAVGNGLWDQNNSQYGTNWGESMLKLSTSGALSVSFADKTKWFTPNIWKTLNNGDLDLGSSGLTLLPDQAGPHTHILVGGGKGAVLYVVDRDNMTGVNTPDGAIQEIPEINGDWLFVTPAYFNGYIYYAPSGGALEQRAVGYNATDGSYISTTAITSADTFNNAKGSGAFISSNGTANGIVWSLTGNGIRAYDAKNISGSPIYSANAVVPTNVSCQTTKFSLPMVANGKLYYTAYSGTNTGHLLVYGLLPTATGSPAAPTNAVATATTAKSINVTWTRNSTNESGFLIKRSSTANGTFSQVGTVGAGVTAYTDSGLTASTTYYYQVVATNAAGNSSATNVASATTFPAYVESGLVAYWPLDETGGTSVSDATGNGHTGTVNGEAGLTTGFINYGVNLHGTGQATSNVSVPNTSALQFTAAQSFTLAAWVYPSALRGSEETIFAKSRDTGNYYGVWINASNQYVFRGPGGDLVGPAATESTWTHVAVVQDGAAGTRKIYINGQLAASGASQAGDGTGALWMGQQNISGNYESFPGTIDEVRLYSRALTAGQVTDVMGPPVLEGQSTQTHGNAGTFSFNVWPAATTVIEPRKGSTTGSYTLVLHFSAPVSGITASLQTLGGTPAVGTAGSASYDTTGQVVTIPLTGVGNAQLLNLHLAGIAPGNGTADIPFNVLWGDVNLNNVANALDATIVKNSHTTLVNSSSFLYDLNCDGAVNSADDSLATAAVGTSIGLETDTDLALFQPTTPLSVNGNNIGAYAVDTDITTRWESTQKVDPQYIYVNLGVNSTIHQVVLYWENAAGQNYTIDSSPDASSWTNLSTITGNTTANTYQTYPSATTTYANATGNFVRMYGTTRATVYGYSLYDFKVIGINGTGAPYAPTVNSAPTASAGMGNSFSYQVAGTNAPTSYNATGLPTGLSINSSTGLISGTPTQSGTFTVTITATNNTGTGSSTLTLTVATPLAYWQSQNFTSSDLSNPAISGLTATPAGDGITNLMKYALNLKPKVNGVGGLPTESMTATGGQNYLTLTYTKVIAATDITYAVEVSSDMQTWNSGSGYTTTVSTMNNPDNATQNVVVRDLTATSGSVQRFIRLKVTKP